MSGKVPHAAFCEEFDEDANAIVPETRRVANVTAKRSNPNPNPNPRSSVALDAAGSDSGYSSRTAATANSSSAQSPTTTSGTTMNKSPSTTTTANFNNDAFHKSDLDKSVRSIPTRISAATSSNTSPARRKDRPKDHRPTVRPNVGGGSTYSAHPPPPPPPLSMPTTPNKSSRRGRGRRDSACLQHYPGTCLECDQGLYHAPTTPIDPSPISYPYYPAPQLPTPANLNMNDRFPPPPPPPPTSTYRYPPAVVQDHAHVSNSCYANKRPVSYHGAMPGMGGLGSMGYNASVMNPYDYGPPPSSSAYANTPARAPYIIPAQYASSSSHHRQPRYYVGQLPQPQPRHQPRPRPARSGSRTRDLSRPRRSSVYGSPALDHDTPASPYEDAEPLERQRSSRGRRASVSRHPSHSSHAARDPDEDFYRMPPPPRPSTTNTPQQSKPTPQVIQNQKRPEPLRKAANFGSSSIPHERRSSKYFDLSEMEAALPERPIHKSNREIMLPERSHSTNNEGRRPTVYRGSSRQSRVSVENPRRHQSSHHRGRRASQQQTSYHYDGSDIEEKQRKAEEYQAARSGRSLPHTTDALVNAKASSHGAAESDSGSGSGGSQKSRSSRGSATRALGSYSRMDDENDNNIHMTIDGMSIGIKHGSIDGKTISVRSGEDMVEFNFEGRRPGKYLTTGRSDYSGGSGSASGSGISRSTRRSSRSAYGSRGVYD